MFGGAEGAFVGIFSLAEAVLTCVILYQPTFTMMLVWDYKQTKTATSTGSNSTIAL